MRGGSDLAMAPKDEEAEEQSESREVERELAALGEAKAGRPGAEVR